MSHEIRTPMNAIIGLTHLLRARQPPTPLQRERLGKIDDAAQHLLQVINDILDLSKIEAGKLMLEDTDFSLRRAAGARLRAWSAERAQRQGPGAGARHRPPARPRCAATRRGWRRCCSTCWATR